MSIGDGGRTLPRNGAKKNNFKSIAPAEDDVSMHVDEETGQRYSYVAATWLSDDEEVEGDTMDEGQGERKQESARRISFRKTVDDDNAV